MSSLCLRPRKGAESALAQGTILMFQRRNPIKIRLSLAVFATLLLTSLTIPALHVKGADEDQYSFKVHNPTDDKITKLLASEDGDKYAQFDIGKGIKAGETVKLNWDKE